MNDEEWQTKIRAKLQTELETEPARWWWLSFADSTRPEGQQWLGVAVVRAHGFLNACWTARSIGVNPGGEIRGNAMFESLGEPPASLPNRLIVDSTELDRLASEWTGEGVSTVAELEDLDEARARARTSKAAGGDQVTDGKWTCSTHEECWDCGEEFDTRDAALAFAMTTLATDYNVEDGSNVYIGQIHKIAPDEIASYVVSAERVVEDIDERLYELVGDEVNHELGATEEQTADLDERLAAAVRDWMNAHDLAPKVFTLDHVESHTWEQCKEERARPDVDLSRSVHPMLVLPERCVLPIEHDGDCEWP